MKLESSCALILLVIASLISPPAHGLGTCDELFRETGFDQAQRLEIINESAWNLITGMRPGGDRVTPSRQHEVLVLERGEEIATEVLGEVARITGDRWFVIEDQRGKRFLLRAIGRSNLIYDEGRYRVTPHSQLSRLGVTEVNIRQASAIAHSFGDVMVSFLPDFVHGFRDLVISGPYGHEAAFVRGEPNQKYPYGFYSVIGPFGGRFTIGLGRNGEFDFGQMYDNTIKHLMVPMDHPAFRSAELAIQDAVKDFRSTLDPTNFGTDFLEQ